MSTQNILEQGFVQGGYVVTFQSRRGPRSYMYSTSSGAQIANGADPKDYPCQEVPAGSFDLNGAGGTVAEDAEAGEVAVGAAALL